MVRRDWEESFYRQRTEEDKPLGKVCFSPPSGIRVAPMRRDFLLKLPHIGQLRCKGSSHHPPSTPKSMFGKKGAAPLGDRFCYENDLSVLKQKERGHLYGGKGN